MSSRFAVAVHVLAYMAWRRAEAVTSERIAGSVNTNPVVVRRIMGALRKGGMVTVQPGVGGGAMLAREPQHISLLDVYRAVETEDLFALHPQQPCRECDVGGNIQQVLNGVFARAQEAMHEVLEGVTIRDVFHEVAGRAKACGQERDAERLRREA
ncbi:MAG TPA: Rrf2 family transcriptional regulator [Longimicrobiaceae bacterium]|jgi:Rrf2 family protein|nr:Rrf2 family transcriptional regulator [Longimicrobiaceae bacterium]